MISLILPIHKRSKKECRELQLTERVIPQQNRCCYFEMIPVEMAVEILYYLDWRSLIKAGRVCKLWYEECKREKLWQQLCIRMFGNAMDDPFVHYIREKKSWQWILRSKVLEFKEEDSKSGIGFVIYKNGDRYEGEWKENKREGFGILRTGVDTYVGHFAANSRDGTGLCISKNGSRYEGEWKKDLRHGKGKYLWSNGDIYDGEFKSHSRDGYGLYKWPSNDRYEGYFKNNAKHGTGCFYFANGDKFEGEYVEGKRNGKGTYTWPHGDIFTGEYKDDARNGHGIYEYAYGGKYSGSYLKDKRHGKGCFTWPDGDRFIGTWEAESRRGPGTLYCSDGRIYHLVWNESDNANYAYVVPDKFPNPNNSKI